MDQSTTRKTIKLYWSHASSYPKYLWPLLLVMPLNVILGDFIAPYITSQVLQKISTGNYDATGLASLWDSFGTQISLYAACVIASR